MNSHPLSFLSGQNVVVTGAASGIGKACCEQLAGHGVHVIGMDRSPADLPCLTDFVTFDQGDYTSISAAVEKLPARVDGLLNVAGLAPGAQIEPATILSVNFFGVRYLTEKLVSRLAAGAAVVNMGSGTGAGWMSNLPLLRELLAISSPEQIAAVVKGHQVTTEGTGNQSAYPISKQLLAVWTMQAAVMLKSKEVRVNAVAPAAVDTPILQDFLSSFGTEAAQRIASFGTASADSVAASALLLMGRDAARINGAVIPVDAGAVASGTLKKLGLID